MAYAIITDSGTAYTFRNGRVSRIGQPIRSHVHGVIDDPIVDQPFTFGPTGGPKIGQRLHIVIKDTSSRHHPGVVTSPVGGIFDIVDDISAEMVA